MLIYDPKTKISNHFTMREVAKSPIADRLIIDNTPTTTVLEAAEYLAVTILDPIRDHFGISFSPNSWYRSEALEKAINKTAYETWCHRKGKQINDASWTDYFSLKSHPKGEAADIEIPGITNDDLFNWVQHNIPVFDQLIREFPKENDPTSGWVHVSIRKTNNRKEVFKIG